MKCGKSVRDDRMIFKFVIAILTCVTVTIMFMDYIETGLLGALFVIYFLAIAALILYGIVRLLLWLLEKIVPKETIDAVALKLIERQEQFDAFQKTQKRNSIFKSSQSRYKAQYRQSTQWWDVCPPTFENAAISYAEKYKDNNPEKKVRVVEVVDGKIVGTIYSC